MAALLLLLLASYCIAGLANANELQVARKLDSPSSEEGDSHEEVHNHHLAKRQTQQCQVFYLQEPPSSLQCNPEPSKTLTLRCQFFANIITQIPLDIGWYFSLNGVDAELVQVSRFVWQTQLTAFENVLVVRIPREIISVQYLKTIIYYFIQVLNALPGTYFCSSVFAGTGTLFDSRSLRISNATLHDLCATNESPTQQPPFPRCLQNCPVPNAIPQPSTIISRTSTVNFQRGAIEVTPTYSAELEYTIYVPLETMTFAPMPTPTPSAPTPSPTLPATATEQEMTPLSAENRTGQTGVIVGAVVGVVVALAVVMAVVLGILCYLRSAKKKGKMMNQPNVEPLLAQRPPEGPPPVFSNQKTNQEYIELNDLGPIPLPYERVLTNKAEPRYTGGPAIEKRKGKKKKAVLPQRAVPVPVTQTSPVPVSVAHTPPISESPVGIQNSYYSRPKFYKKERERGRRLSTSTHFYGDLGFDQSEDSSLYISADSIEPFHHNWAKLKRSQAVADKDEGDLQSSLAYTASELPEDGTDESYEYTDEEVDEEEEEEEEEMENEHDHHSLIESEDWSQRLGKSPKTGQSKVYNKGTSHHYVNTKGQRQVDDVAYINTKRVKDGEISPYATSRTKKVILQSTQGVPNTRRPKKKTRKVRKNKSSPAIVGEEQQEYTSITRDTINYTSVYASTQHKIGHIQETILEEMEEV